MTLNDNNIYSVNFEEFHINQLTNFFIDKRIEHRISFLVTNPSKLNLSIKVEGNITMELLDEISRFVKIEYITFRNLPWLELQCISWTENSREEDVRSGKINKT